MNLEGLVDKVVEDMQKVLCTAEEDMLMMLRMVEDKLKLLYMGRVDKVLDCVGTRSR